MSHLRGIILDVERIHCILQKAGRPLFRNSFTRGAVDGSINFNPFDLNFKNVANTGVLPWGGQLYALWEVSQEGAADASASQGSGVRRVVYTQQGMGWGRTSKRSSRACRRVGPSAQAWLSDRRRVGVTKRSCCPGAVRRRACPT